MWKTLPSKKLLAISILAFACIVAYLFIYRPAPSSLNNLPEQTSDLSPTPQHVTTSGFVTKIYTLSGQSVVTLDEEKTVYVSSQTTYTLQKGRIQSLKGLAAGDLVTVNGLMREGSGKILDAQNIRDVLADIRPVLFEGKVTSKVNRFGNRLIVVRTSANVSANTKKSPLYKEFPEGTNLGLILDVSTNIRKNGSAWVFEQIIPNDILVVSGDVDMTTKAVRAVSIEVR